MAARVAVLLALVAVAVAGNSAILTLRALYPDVLVRRPL